MLCVLKFYGEKYKINNRWIFLALAIWAFLGEIKWNSAFVYSRPWHFFYILKFLQFVNSWQASMNALNIHFRNKGNLEKATKKIPQKLISLEWQLDPEEKYVFREQSECPFFLTHSIILRRFYKRKFTTEINF